MEDTYNRFSRVVENYSRYRPRYPHQLVEQLKAECGLAPAQIVGDIGAGTGLLAELFLKNGNPVYGVEPNLEMRLAADDPRYPTMLDELTAIFSQCQAGGTVTLEYDTKIVYGQLSA